MTWLARFRACRWFLPPHMHFNGMCSRDPVERYIALNHTSTYRLYYSFRLWLDFDGSRPWS